VEEDFYSVDEAARILKLTPGRIRQMLRAGELEGLSPDESGERGWRIPMHAVHDRDRPGRVEQAPEAPESPERLSDLEVEVRELRYQLGLSRGRIEITEKAESTLREALERERERADSERERAERLQAELDQARLPWWKRWFGGERGAP
jgi:excisionase family DNA binding protein